MDRRERQSVRGRQSEGGAAQQQRWREKLSGGRFLRSIAGVEEDVFGHYRGERARFASLGAVVLGTSSLAALSMAIALTQVFDGFRLLLLLPAVAWGLLVLSFDRWLVSSGAGKGPVASFALYVPRLAWAAVVGAVVAVPLVLQVFDTAIVAEVGEDRLDRLAAEHALSTRCNPHVVIVRTGSGGGGDVGSPGPNPAGPTAASAPEAVAVEVVVEDATAASDPACSGVTFQPGAGATGDDSDGLEDPRALAAQRRQTVEQLVDQEARLASIDGAVAALTARKEDECLGVESPETSGREGNGPLCQGLEGDLNRLIGETRAERDDLLRRITQLRDGVTDLDRRVAVAVTAWNAAIDSTVAERDRARTALLDDSTTPEQVDGPIGLLERLEALDRLNRDNDTIRSASLALTALLVLIDLAPALVKILSGSSVYERLVAEDSRVVLEIAHFRADAAIARATGGTGASSPPVGPAPTHAPITSPPSYTAASSPPQRSPAVFTPVATVPSSASPPDAEPDPVEHPPPPGTGDGAAIWTLDEIRYGWADDASPLPTNDDQQRRHHP